jgi:isopenicillin N synthase-like dioxygenase
MADSDEKLEQSRANGRESSNQEFRSYEQVQKDQNYRLAEGLGAEEYDHEFEIPTCDMGPLFGGGAAGKQAFAKQLGGALEQIGFAILTGHGIEPRHYERMDQKIREFFHEVPEEERLPFIARRHGSVNQGYFPLKTTSNIHPDLVQGWVFCRRAFNMLHEAEHRAESFWPRPGFEPLFRQHCLRHEDLFLPLMQSILRYLDCDPHHFDKQLTQTNFGLRLNFYPALKPDQDSGSGRMLGHEDVDLFTLLPAPSVDGLQVLNRKNMKWVRLQAPPGSLILNVGDYLQRISNDRLPSTTHRVARPSQGADQDRVSLPMAVYLREQVLLEVLPGLGTPHYEPITALKFHTHITAKYYGDDYAVD